MRTTEQSYIGTASKSTDSLHSEYRTQIQRGSYKWIDSYFSLFDFYYLHCRLPSILLCIRDIFLILQILFSSIWPYLTIWDGVNSISILKTYLLFYDQEYYSSWKTWIKIGILVMVFGFLWCIMYSMRSYKTSHQYGIWNAIIIFIFVEIIFPLSIFFFASYFGYCVNSFINIKSNENIFSLLISVISGTLAISTTYCYLLTLSRSLYQKYSFLSIFDPSVLISFLIHSSYFLIASIVFNKFSNFVLVAFIIINSVIKVSVLFSMDKYPFISIIINELFLSITLSNIVNNITIVIYFFIKFDSIAIVLGLEFIICSLISFIKFNRSIKHFKLEWVHHNNSIDYLSKDEGYWLFILRLSFILASEPFIDMSFIKNLAQSTFSNETICSCLFHVSFIPSETRLTNILFSNTIKKKDLNLKERYLLYQANKIKILRQSSTTSEINNQLASLNNSTAECESIIKNFWNRSSVSLSYLVAVKSLLFSTKSLWEENLGSYPNNPKFCNDYCNFLIDTLCDFEYSIIMKQRGDLIELGKRFSVDSCYIFFVERFPQYLKKKIMDQKGNFQNNAQKGLIPKNDQSESNSMTNDEFMDVEVEETIGKQLFDHTKLRLSLSRALKNRKPNSTSNIHNVYTLIFILIVTISIILILISIEIIEPKRNIFLQLFNMLKSRNSNGLSGLSLLLHYSYYSNRLELYSDIRKEISYNSNNNHYIGVENNSFNLSMSWMKNSRQFFHDLLSEVAIMSSSGVIIPEVMNTLIQKGSQMSYCASAKVVSSSKTDMGTVFAYQSFVVEQILALVNQTQLFENDYFCEYMITWLSSIESSNRLVDSYKEVIIYEYGLTNDQMIQFYYIIPITLGSIMLIPVIVFYISFNKEIKRVSKSLLSIDQSLKTQISNHIRIDGSNQTDSQIDKQISSAKWCREMLFVITVGVVTVFVSIFEINSSISSIKSTKNIILWELNSISRGIYIAESLQHMILSIILNEPSAFSITNQTFHSKQTKDSIKELERNNKELFEGSTNYDACQNFDSILDDLNLKEPCSSNETKSTFFDYYKCAPMNQAIGMFSTICIEIIEKAGNKNGSLSFPDMVYALDVSGNYLFSRLEQFDERSFELFDIIYQRLTKTILIMSGLIIALGIIWYTTAISISEAFSSLFDILLIQIKRIPPPTIIGNSKLMEIILNKDKIDQKQEESISGRIIQTSSDAIVCSGLNNIVEMVNTSVSGLLGYTPEQLLGQSISLIFSINDSEKVMKQISLMKNGQSSAIFTDHIECLTDNGIPLPCFLTILGMNSTGDNAITSFVYILKDECELKHQQKESETAKAKSEELLYQILPREIVMRINQGEKEISFTIPSSTIIFIDIVKFSDYSIHLPPNEILEHLSLIFTSFDSIAEKYPLITKIKLIGDVYMAAAGLFSDSQGMNHAEQMVRFAIDALQELETINIRLNSSINVRIGINSGGPIIAGVLGTDKPVFDIIGDPINVASRLQSTCIPGRIQISQSTFDLVKEAAFEIEKRGEIFLKGKGNTMAYFVNPDSNFFPNFSNCDIKSMNSMNKL